MNKWVVIGTVVIALGLLGAQEKTVYKPMTRAQVVLLAREQRVYERYGAVVRGACVPALRLLRRGEGLSAGQLRRLGV